MWRNKRNVRIGYTPREPTTAAGRPVARNCDLVEWEPVSGKGGVKSVSGTNTASGAPLKPSTAPAEASSAPLNTGSWDWRGKGLLFWVTSHWEILGWGERPLPGGGIERWAVTWFTPSMFTQEGIDIYADRKGGLSKETAGEIIQHLKTLPTEKLASMCESDLKEVEIKLPWKERTKLGH
ncbi:hypothetical protein P8C59_005445 [Phyllachora maydis]|uniref:Uncharacterized protein n=1 Tax=Phyllachora maydis TaxID=1825666 RepID=A0AAD9I4G0_9PEZI|nr:hypothetical protein P8C59_005445 [Phyllachora maydis]